MPGRLTPDRHIGETPLARNPAAHSSTGPNSQALAFTVWRASTCES